MKFIRSIGFNKQSSKWNERRLRWHIYVDVWVPRTEDEEVDREATRRILEEYSAKIPNAFIGGVDTW